MVAASGGVVRHGPPKTAVRLTTNGEAEVGSSWRGARGVVRQAHQKRWVGFDGWLLLGPGWGRRDGGGAVLAAEAIQCFGEASRRIGANLLVGNGNEPAPIAAGDSDTGAVAELEGYDAAVQEGEPEGTEVKPCFDR